MNSSENEVREVLAAINQAWRQNTPESMRPNLHPDVTMSLPGFTGVVIGRDTLIESFNEFCTNAKVLEYSESHEQIIVAGNVGIATFRFDMTYERPTYREHSTGRDFWVFERAAGRWVAVWRTLLELEGSRQPSS